MRRVLVVAVAAAAVTGCARGAPATGQAPRPVLEEQASGTGALLQAVSPVSERVAWVAGHRGTYARTTDGGTSWQAGRVAGADTLEFRDVHAVSAEVAYLLAAGAGELSRIYKTVDGGRSWQLQFQNRDPAAFYDCFDFWDAEHGVAVSDAVNGRLVVLTTDDGGATWAPVPADGLPPALAGEGAFAASGTCLVVRGRAHAWIGTGAMDGARVYATADRGRSWRVVATPVVSGRASGIASLAFRDQRRGLALGGRLGAPDSVADNVAATTDGGATWRLAGRPTFTGAVYGAAYVPDLPGTLVAVSPRGMALTTDDGATWASLSSSSYWAVAFASSRTGWAVGPGGRITGIRVR